MTTKIEIDLALIRGAKFENGNILIPAKENEIRFFKKKDGSMHMALSLMAISRREVGKYGETHVVKQSLTSEERNKLAQGGAVELPIIGNIIDKNWNKEF